MTHWKAGDRCWVQWRDGNREPMPGVIIMASDGGRSLVVSVEGIIAGWVGMAPLSWDGRYCEYETLDGTPVKLTPIDERSPDPGPAGD